MRKFLSLIAIIALFASQSSAQEDSGSAATLTLSDYMSNLSTGTACASTAGTLGATGSGVPTCVGVDTDDVWYTFNANTQGVLLEVETGNFDAVIQLFDDGLNSISCENINGANAGESLRFTTLNKGNDYFIRVYSSNGTGGTFNICGQYLPEAYVRDGFHPTPATDTGLPGFKLIEVVKRNNILGASFVEATHWLYVNSNDATDFYELTINGTSTIISLNANPQSCFGNSYDIYVEVMVGGEWCGYGEPREVMVEAEPLTQLEPLYLGGVTANVDGGLMKVDPVGQNQLMEWRFTTDLGATVLTYQSESTICYLQDVECMRYNKIYSVEIRVLYCGQWGSWSAPEVVTTNPLPYTKLRDVYCGWTALPGSTVLCDFIEGADQYAWQIAPIEEGDEEMVPIGPAEVVYTTGTALYLLSLNLEVDKFYRFGVKSFVGVSDDCGEIQESDYGQFCVIELIGSGEINVIDSQDDFQEEFTEQRDEVVTQDIEEEGIVKIFPNPFVGESVSIEFSNIHSEGSTWVRMYDLSGKMVKQEQLIGEINSGIMQIDVPSNLNSGMYVFVIQNEDQVWRQTVIKK